MKKTKFLLPVLSLFLLSFDSCQEHESPGFSVSVEAEEIVYEFVNPDNGSSPMWCHGNTCIVRYGDKVFASGMETLEDHPPMLNTRWLMFERSDEGWELVYRDEKDRTREPSPLALLGNGDVLLSVNPTLTPPGEDGGPAESYILKFDGDAFPDGYETLVPDWEDELEFRQHTYRSFAVDASANDLVLFQNYRDTAVAWTFRDGVGRWSSKGFLYWPMGETYEKPEPIRICYPAVQLKDRAVHFLGVSDIVEPVSAWKEYKFELTGRKWDYDFRRLFYIWSEDIGTGEFEEWVEISSREATAGHIFPCDLWVAPNGLVHILWEERALDERLREEFFPDSVQSYSLNHAVLRDGEVFYRSPVLSWEEGEDGSYAANSSETHSISEANDLIPGRGRFHVTPDDRLFVFYYVRGLHGDFQENRIVEILPDYSLSDPVVVELERPFSNFFTATVRGGSAPSYILDVFGKDGKEEMRYARVRILL